MNRTRLSRLAIAFVLMAVSAGCAKKITRVDSSFIAPEGRFSSDARMIVYADLPETLFTYVDRPPVGGGPEDSLISTDAVYNSGPGVVNGIIVDGTDASGFQVLRRESGGGYAQLKDFIVRPTLKWLESQHELYRFTDTSPGGYSPSSYLGRGLVSGTVTMNSPLTNAGVMNGTSVPNMIMTSSPFPSDSLFDVSWTPVAGAATYWVQVYQYQLATPNQKVLSSAPSPFALGPIRDLFVASVPAPDTTYKLGGPNGQMLARKVILRQTEYNVRISAVGSDGRLLGYTYGTLDTLRGSTTFSVYHRGAYVVTPGGGGGGGGGGGEGGSLVVGAPESAPRANRPSAHRNRIRH